MDIAVPGNKRRRRLRRLAIGLVACLVLGTVTVAVSRLEPAAPTVDRATVWIDTVTQGQLVRDVRGLGTLVPEASRWVPAATVGRVDRIMLQPGTPVGPEAVILELSNPTLEQERRTAALTVRAAEAGLRNLRVQLDNEYLQQQVAASAIDADYEKAVLHVEANEQLAAKHLIPALVLRESQMDAQQLAAHAAMAHRQLDSQRESMDARLAVQQAEVDRARATLQLKEQQVDDLRVRAGLSGVLQVVPVEVGQQVTPGTNLARVADPTQLKAELKIPETQAKDVQIGQTTRIDTRNGVVRGHVTRIDPSVQDGTVTVDVALDEALPRGARPDLSVDGTIELERLADVLHVGRPAFGQEQGTVQLFRLGADGHATRVPVTLGRASVNAVEIQAGLRDGDQVILSDMSAWDAFDRIRIQ